MSLIFSILILAGVIWLMRKLFEDPDMPKTDAKSQIRLLRKEFYSEISKLKERVYELELQLGKNSIDATSAEKPEMFDMTNSNEQDFERKLEENIFQKELQEPLYEKHHEEVDKEEEFIEEETSEPKIEQTGLFDDLINKLSQKNEFESYITVDLFNKIGALALIIGMGFFLKYSFDTNLFSPMIQTLLSLLFSGGLLFLASHFNKTEKYKILSRGIAGAGLSISYLVIYSGYDYYHLFNYPVTFILMLANTVLAFQQALKYDSIAVALLGIAGGFITPFIIYSQDNNIAGLFTYLAFLNCWVVALSYKKDSWKIIEIISLFAAYITYFTLQGGSNYEGNTLTAGLFLCVIWGLYFGLDITKIARKIKEYSMEGNFLNILNGVLFYGGIYSLLHSNTDSTIIATLIIAMIYISSGVMVYFKYDKLDDYLKQNFFVFLSLVVIATNIASAGFIKTILFSIEAFLLLYFGTRLNKAYVWKSATYLFSFAALVLLFNGQSYSYNTVENFIPIFNLRALTFLILIGFYMLGVRILDRVENTNGIISLYQYSYTTLLFVLFSVEISDLITKLTMNSAINQAGLVIFNRSMVQSTVWISYSSKLLYSGIEKSIKPFIKVGFIVLSIALFVLLVQGFTFVPSESFIPLFNLRFAAFLIAIFSLVFVSKVLNKHQMLYPWAQNVQSIFTYTWCTLLFILLGVEIKDLVSRLLMHHANIYSSIEFYGALIMAVTWITYATILLTFGIKNERKPFINSGLVVFFIGFLNLLAHGCSFSASGAFIPVINLRFVAFIITAGCMFFVYKLLEQDKHNYDWKIMVQSILTYTWCLTLFILLNCEINDFFVRNALSNAFNQHMVFGIAWSLFSLPLIKKGLDKKSTPLMICGFTVILFSVILGFATGVEQSGSSVLLLNMRILMFVILAVALAFAHGWIQNTMKNHPETSNYLKLLQIILSLLMFYMLTLQIQDYYGSTIFTGWTGVQQLVTSITWLLYSIVLMAFGIIKRMKVVRYIALTILGLTIFKVFVLDLSYLDQLSRIISFIGLGGILLLVSFFYQKYSEQIKRLINEDITIETK